MSPELTDWLAKLTGITLDRLPSELIQQIVGELDDAEQLRLRRVTKALKAHVEELPGYQATLEKVRRVQRLWRAVILPVGDLDSDAVSMLGQEPEALLPEQRQLLDAGVEALITSVETAPEPDIDGGPEEHFIRYVGLLAPIIHTLGDRHKVKIVENIYYHPAMWHGAAISAVCAGNGIDDDFLNIHSWNFLTDAATPPPDYLIPTTPIIIKKLMRSYKNINYGTLSDIASKLIGHNDHLTASLVAGIAPLLRKEHDPDVREKQNQLHSQLRAAADDLTDGVYRDIALFAVGGLDPSHHDGLVTDILDATDDLELVQRLTAASSILHSFGGDSAARIGTRLSNVWAPINLGLIASDPDIIGEVGPEILSGIYRSIANGSAYHFSYFLSHFGAHAKSIDATIIEGWVNRISDDMPDPADRRRAIRGLYRGRGRLSSELYQRLVAAW